MLDIIEPESARSLFLPFSSWLLDKFHMSPSVCFVMPILSLFLMLFIYCYNVDEVLELVSLWSRFVSAHYPYPIHKSSFWIIIHLVSPTTMQSQYLAQRACYLTFLISCRPTLTASHFCLYHNHFTKERKYGDHSHCCLVHFLILSISSLSILPDVFCA